MDDGKRDLPFPFPSSPARFLFLSLQPPTTQRGRELVRERELDLPFPFPLSPARFLFLFLQPPTTQRERASIQTINYHSRLRHYTVVVLNCTKVCVSFGCFSYICFSFLLFSGWLYSYKTNLLSVLQKTAVLTNSINYVKYILKNNYLVTVNKRRLARVTSTLHIS